jgi:hypothetical protein
VTKYGRGRRELITLHVHLPIIIFEKSGFAAGIGVASILAEAAVVHDPNPLLATTKTRATMLSQERMTRSFSGLLPTLLGPQTTVNQRFVIAAEKRGPPSKL